MTTQSILATIILLISTQCLAFPIPKEEPVPGGVAYVSLGTEKPLKVSYKGSPVLFRQVGPIWQAIVGIPISTPPTSQTLTMKNSRGETTSVHFALKDKHYEEQHLTIANKRKVNPYAKDMTRIIEEKKQITTAFKQWTADNVDPNEQFILPVSGPMSSPFGRKRFFNKQARKPHSGLDIAADEGTPIIAPLSGRVILTGNFFFNGNSVFIDHGHGLISMYCHMSRINVKKQQAIQQGTVLGEIGQTGRVTGPHLHWSISLNNARIDPLLFFEKNPFTTQENQH